MSLARFVRTVRHIPPGRLWNRLWLMVRRRLTMSPLGRSRRVRRRTPLPVQEVLPVAVFPPREHLVRMEQGRCFLTQLNRSWPLDCPVDWKLQQDPQSSHLERLAFHYLEFLESLPLSEGEAVVLDWIRSTPPWQPGYWLDSWNSYAVSIRTVCLMQWLARFRTELSPSTWDTVCGSVVEQLRFLRRNLEIDIRGNHLIRNIKALLWGGRFFAGSEAQEWARCGLRLLQSELRDQFLSDGMHFELSPAYHCQVFGDLLDCVVVLPEERRPAVMESLQPAAQVVADLTHPDERISLFSDGGLNMVWSPQQCLDVWSQLGGGVPRARAVVNLAASGYYGVRHDQDFLVFDCGPSCADSLPAHGHGDLLAFEWDVAAKRIVVDAGVREYEPGTARNWSRSTQAHNTVTVGNRDQCEFTGSFRVGQRAHARCTQVDLQPESFSVSGCYTAGFPDGQQVVHQRTLQASPGTVQVTDELQSRRPEPAVARLLLHHDCQVHQQDGQILITCDGREIDVQSTSPIRVRPAVWSPDFGTEYPTNQLEIDYGETPCRGEFRLIIRNRSSS